MKKIRTLSAFMWCLGICSLHAQTNDTMYIHQGQTVIKHAIKDVDSITFYLAEFVDHPQEWTVQLRLKPLVDESYLATENPEIKALISKHDVTFYQSYPEFDFPVFLLYHTLMGNNYYNDKKNIIKDFLASDLFDDNVRDYCIHFACGVELKLIPQEDENYLATEDPKIQALVAKHGVAFRQAYPGSINPILGLYYVLFGGDNMPKAIQDFLATGKFEEDFYDYGDVNPAGKRKHKP